MINVENIEVWGFKHAIRGMRNPLNSWNRSDSTDSEIGIADLDLMRRLFRAGTEHRKYLRQIFVSMDITAPLYWWKEADTYKIGTVANSCSTMHKIHSKDFSIDDFSIDHLKDLTNEEYTEAHEAWVNTINLLNYHRQRYIETKGKRYWWQLIEMLPNSYNQKRTITMNYENAASMIKQRTGHKLDEWNEFVKILKDLPYIKEITED